MFVTITPQNSVYSTTIAKVLNAGDKLSLLPGAYLAGDEVGLRATGGGFEAAILGTVSGNIGIDLAGYNTFIVGQGGAVIGGASAVQATGLLSIVNQGQFLSDSDGSAATPECATTFLRVVNRGLIASGDWFNQSGSTTAISVTSGAMDLENSGMIDGQVLVRNQDRANITNTGILTAGIDWGASDHDFAGGYLINSGVIRGYSSFYGGSWSIDTSDGRMGEVRLHECDLDLTAENARIAYLGFTGDWVEVDGTWQQTSGGSFTLTGEQARIGSLNVYGTYATMHDLDGSRIGSIGITAETIDLDLTGARVPMLWLTGDIHLVLDGASTRSVTVKGPGAEIDASAATRGIDFTIGDGHDQLLATSGDDSVTDDGGVDWISLGAGDDIYFTGVKYTWIDDTQVIAVPENCADIIRGGAGFDWYYGATTALRVDLVSGRITELVTDGAVDRVFGIEAARGSILADVMIGNRWDNAFDGSDGDDTLTGGDGADVFIYAGRSGNDLIRDFQPGEDLLDLQGLHAKPKPNDAPYFTFLGLDPGPPGERKGLVGYTHAGDQTIVTVYLPNSWASPLTITLAGTLTLTEADFLL